jgi:hypothetical protein
VSVQLAGSSFVGWESPNGLRALFGGRLFVLWDFVESGLREAQRIIILAPLADDSIPIIFLLLPYSLCGVIPIPLMCQESQIEPTLGITNHGNLTDQFRKIAARPSSIISVITELPFLKNIPPRAGNSAKASGAECHAEDSWLCSCSTPVLLGFGSSRSSVDDWKVLRASFRE